MSPQAQRQDSEGSEACERGVYAASTSEHKGAFGAVWRQAQRSGLSPAPHELLSALGSVFGLILLLLLLLPAISSLEAQDTAQAGSQTNQAPFLQFRNRTLDYAGPELEEDEPTNVDEVRLGWFGPSHPEDSPGGDLWWAADLAIREANEQGGFRGKPFRLIPKWSENPWGNGIPLVFRMVYEDKVLALVGGIDGPSTHLAEQVVAKACLPLVSPVSTDKSVNLAGVPWMFSCAPGDQVIASLLAEAVVRALKNSNDKLVVFSATDHDSRMAAREILKALSDQHRGPDFKLEFQPGVKTFDTQLSGIGSSKPGVILVIAGPEDSAQLVVAIRKRLAEAVIFGTHQMGRSRFLQLAGKAAEDVHFPLLWTPVESDADTRKFIESFRARYGREPDYAAALSFDATRLLIAATRQGSLNRARIREALSKLSPWQGITGPIQWDGTGQNVRKVSRMGTITNGRIMPASDS